jgi:hypothetical protein
VGHRANYVLVDDGGFSLFYSHWGANRVDRDFFWGPAHALDFVRKQDPTNEWLDEVWCEGGALIDVPKRVLLFFGGEDICHDPLRHRVTLALMRRPWAGWTVSWAREGLGDFADHLGLSRDLVSSGSGPDARDLADLDGEPLDWPSGVVSLRLADGRVAIHRVVFDARELFDFGPGVVDRLAARPGSATMTVSLHGEGGACGGIHLDVAARQITLWSPGYDKVRRAWAGWQLVHHGDRFEAHEEATGGALRFVTRPQHEVVDGLVQRLLSSSDFDPQRLLEATKAARPGLTIEVNPLFFSYHPHELSDAERARSLTWALADQPSLWR